MHIAIQGELGSFSHEIALKMFPGATIVPCMVSADVFNLVEEKDVAAVIPIENSLAGPVVEHFDLLFQREVRIEAESLLRIRHNLIGMPGARLEEIQRVFSHPVALAQCRRFFARYPEIVATPSYDTAGSVKQVMESGDRSAGAIASMQAALWYGGEVLAPDIEDNPANYTRFFLIRKRRSAEPPPRASTPVDTGKRADADKLSIAFIVENRPGTLVAALQVFAGNRTNLNKIESRPVHGRPWEYIFYVDCQVSQAEAAIAILDQLGRCCRVVKELGLYPAATPVA